MKVLWLTPCYNAEHLLPFFFASLRELNPKPDFIIFSENNSTDKTLQMLVDYKEIPNIVLKLVFIKDIVKKKGAYHPMAKICQRLWGAARFYDTDYTILTAVDTFVRSPDAIETLIDWNVDFVTARVARSFPEGLMISAKWKHPTNPKLHRMFKPQLMLRWLVKGELLTARIMNKPVKLLDDTPLMASGFFCFSRKLVQDKRLNWFPIPKSPVKGDHCSEDFGFCKNAAKLGYKIHLDELVILDHVVYDKHHLTKAWTLGASDKFEF